MNRRTPLPNPSDNSTPTINFTVPTSRIGSSGGNLSRWKMTNSSIDRGEGFMHDPELPIEFKYNVVDEKGRAKISLRKKGRYDGQTFTLDKETFAASALRGVRFDGPIVQFAIATSQNEGEVRAVQADKTEKLVKKFSRVLSRRESQVHCKHLSRMGRQDDFVTHTCPQCECVIDVSCLPDGPLYHCHHCDVFIDATSNATTNSAHSQCAFCNYYAHPRLFTSAYIIFLGVAISWQQKQTMRCHVCMRKEAWKMFFGNMVTVVGLVVAIPQLIRTYAAPRVHRGKLKGLDHANLLAQKGQLEEAMRAYEEIESRATHCPGVRFNRGVAFVSRGKEHFSEAATHFLSALTDCPNHWPSFEALKHCYAELDQQDELKEVDEMWDQHYPDYKHEPALTHQFRSAA